MLLILAGVAIVTLKGENGILNRASTAKNMTEEAEEKQKEDLGKLEDLIDGKARDGLTEAEIDAKIAAAISNANKEEILWTNPNPTSDFDAQTVSWTKLEYNRIYILYKNYKTDTVPSYTNIAYPGLYSLLFGGWNDSVRTYSWVRYASFNANKTSVEFRDCYDNTKTKNNGYGVPIYIIGYKSTLNI